MEAQGKRQQNWFRKAISLALAVIFVLTSANPSFAQAGAGGLDIPAPGQMVGPGKDFVPLELKGVKVVPDNGLKLDFFLDTGNTHVEGEALKAEAGRLVRYFLAALTIPENELWVNLSPYEKDRIVPDSFGKTEMGRDLLAQDYILKQLTASLIFPEGDPDRKFWKEVYQRAQEKFGTTDIPVEAFNKVWIVPDHAVVYEDERGAIIAESRLKVMLESDYLAQNEGRKDARPVLARAQDRPGTIDEADRSSIVPRPSSNGDTQNVAKDVLREVIVPVLEREVNDGENFARLRQVYHALILAVWFKRRLRDSLLGKNYADQGKTSGIDLADPEAKQEIYDRYVEAFRKGVYNYIREEQDPLSGEIVPRKYFSGGVSWADAAQKIEYRSLTRDVLAAGIRVIGAPLLALVTLAQPVTAQVQPTVRQVQNAVPQAGRLEAHDQAYWMSLANEQHETIFDRVGEFIREPYAIDVLKEATLSSANGPFHTSRMTAYERAAGYLKYDRGWEFLEWLAAEEHNLGYFFLGRFLSEPFALRACEVLAKYDQQSMLVALVNGGNSYPRVNSQALKQLLRQSRSERIKMILAVSELPVEFALQQKIAVLIPRILAGDLTLKEAESVARNPGEYVKALLAMYKDPRFPDVKRFLYNEVAFNAIENYVKDRLMPVFQRNPKELDAFFDSLPLQDIYLFIPGQVYGDSPAFFEYIYRKFLGKLRAGDQKLIDLKIADLNFVQVINHLSDPQVSALFAQISLDEQFNILKKYDDTINSKYSFYFPKQKVTNSLTALNLLDRISANTAGNIGADQQGLADSVARQRARLRENILELINEDFINILELTDKIKDQDILNTIGAKAKEEVSTGPEARFFEDAAHYLSQPWGPDVLRAALRNNPSGAVGEDAFRSWSLSFGEQDPVVNILKEIRGRAVDKDVKGQMALLLDDLVSGRLTFPEAQSLTRDRLQLLRRLNEIQSRPGHLGAWAIKAYLEDVYLRFVRDINDLHEQADSVRFKSVESASVDELYRIMIYGEQEIFTSTFNGLFNRLIQRMARAGLTGDQVLESNHYARVRSFIRLLANYGKTAEFLKTMSLEKRVDLINRVVRNIEKENNPLEEAVVLADTFSVVDDPWALEQIQTILKDEYGRVQGVGPEAGTLYGLLAGIFENKAVVEKEWFRGMALRYPLPDITRLAKERLYAPNGVNYQRYFFYNDKDGKASFLSFLEQYGKDPNWRVEKQGAYVKVSSVVGRKIEIYANIPEREEAGQRDIDGILKDAYVSVWVHRGHSYHLAASMTHFPATAAFVYLGSCGGYSSLTGVLDKSPLAHILATQGTGTATVNDPLLKLINQQIRLGNDLDWNRIWGAAENRFGGNEFFGSYISPARNQGVLFIMAYRSALAKGGIQPKSADRAMKMPGNDVGGIDVNPALLDLKVERNGQKTASQAGPGTISEMDIKGLVPVIDRISSIIDLQVVWMSGE